MQRFSQLITGVLLSSCLLSVRVHAVNVLTYHNDLARTGLNSNEVSLTLANINTNTFRKLFSQSVDGYVYAQPLYMANVTIAGKGVHNVVFVGTEHNSVYAFDADDNIGSNTNALWQASFIDPANGITSVPYGELTSYDDIIPEVGITGTPVIDPGTGTLYVVAKTKEVGIGFTNYVQRLHALDIGSGAEKFGGPTTISASTPGSGPGTVGGVLAFDPKMENQRAGLLLLNGQVLISWGSHGDNEIFHGWLMSYNATNLQRTSVFCTTPDASSGNKGQGGIWGGGAAPSADANGNIFVSTGNGDFNADTGGTNYSDSVLRLTITNGIQVADLFTPFNESSLSAADRDLGSGGLLLIPDQSGPNPHLLVMAGKEGRIYLLDRDNLGGFNPLGDSQIVQSIPGLLPVTHFGMPAYWNNTVYFWATGDFLKALRLTNGVLTTTAVSQNDVQVNHPGCQMSVSANGLTNAIVWGLKADYYGSSQPVVLYAYDARDLTKKLYDSSQAGSRDQLGAAVKFSVPTVANGKVYVGTQTRLDVLGLIASSIPPTVHITSPTNGTITTNATIDVTGYLVTNNAIASVVVNNSRGGSTPAVVTGTNWTSASVTLKNGTNVLTAVATDTLTNQASDSVTVIAQGLTSSNSVNTTLRTTRATLVLGAAANSDTLILSGVFNPTGLSIANVPITVQFGDYSVTLASNALVNLKYKAKSSPTNTLTGLSFSLKSRSFTVAASGFTLTNADPFAVALTIGTNALGPDSITFPVAGSAKYSWNYGKPQLPDEDQFFLGKSKLTTNSFTLAGNINVIGKPDVRTNSVALGIGGYEESLPTNGWVKGTGNAYTYTRPVGSTGAVQSMTIDLDLGTWTAKGAGANLTGLTTNAPVAFELTVGNFDATYSAQLLQKGASFSY